MVPPGGFLGQHASLLARQFCDLTTTGRRSRLPRTVELWFAGEDDNIYMVSGGGLAADWVKNLIQEPRVVVTIDDLKFPGLARALDPSRDAEAWTRGAELCARKYYQRGASYLSRGWSRIAVVVEVKVTGPALKAQAQSRTTDGTIVL